MKKIINILAAMVICASVPAVPALAEPQIISYELDHDGDKFTTYVNGEVIDDETRNGSIEITNTSDWWGRTMVSCATATGGTYYSIANSGGTYGANYTVKVPQGKYEVFVRLPILTKNGSDWDKATIVHNGKSDELRYTPYKSAKYWSDGDYLSLGAYDFAGTGTEQVRLEKYRPDGSVDFDSVKLVRVTEQTEVITELELDEQGKAYVDGTAVNDGYVTYESAGRIGDGTSGAAQVLDDSDVWTVPAYGGTLQTRTSDVLGVTYFPKLTAGTYDVYMNNYYYTESAQVKKFEASDGQNGEKNFGYQPAGYVKIGTFEFSGVYGKDFIKFTANSSYATFDTVKFAAQGIIEADDTTIAMHSHRKIEDGQSVILHSPNNEFAQDINADSFEAEGLPEGLYISSVERIDNNTAKIFIGGECAQNLTADTDFTICAKSGTLAGYGKKTNSVKITLRHMPHMVLLTVNAPDRQTDGIQVSGMAENLTDSAIDKMSILVGVYSGESLRAYKIAEIAEPTEAENSASFDAHILYSDILRENETIEGLNYQIRVFAWNSVPQTGSKSGGKILAEEKVR